jgi:hypothetical protein
MENDKKRNLLLLALLGGGVIYLLYKRKPKVIAVGEVQAEESGGGGGGVGGGGGFMPIMPIVPIVVPKTETKPEPKPEPKPTEVFPTCKSGELYNPSTRKCEPIVIQKDTGTSSKPPSGGAGTSAGSGFPILNPFDPCKANGYGGTYDPVTNTCKLSPYCGGGTLKLDSNFKAVGCAVSTSSSGSGGVVIGGNVSGNMPAGPIGGVVGFSGNMPLTIDNLLM